MRVWPRELGKGGRQRGFQGAVRTHIAHYVMHPVAVLSIGRLNRQVPLLVRGPMRKGSVPPYGPDHEIVNADVVRSGKVVDVPFAVGDAHVTYARDAARYWRQRPPHDGPREAVVVAVAARSIFHDHAHRPTAFFGDGLHLFVVERRRLYDALRAARPLSLSLNK